MAKILIQHGADLNSETRFKVTPLSVAATNGSYQIHSNYKFYHFIDLLFFIFMLSGQTEFVKILIENGAEINHQNSFGYTPLHWSSSNGWLYINLN